MLYDDPFIVFWNALTIGVLSSADEGTGTYPPPGFLFLIDNDASQLFDNDGVNLVAPIS